MLDTLRNAMNRLFRRMPPPGAASPLHVGPAPGAIISSAPGEPEPLPEPLTGEAAPGKPLLTATATEAAVLPGADDALLSRTEVLDAELAVRGYEFVLKTELRDKVRAHSRSVRDFLDGMLLDQLAGLRGTALRERQPWIQQWEGGLQRPVLDRLPARAALLVVPERAEIAATPATLARLAALRESGVEVWLDDCVGTPWFASVAGLANGATVRMAWRTPREVADVLNRLRADRPEFAVAAWEVGTVEDFSMARQLGCSRFSGGFVTRRGEWAGNQLSPQVLNVAMLINQVREDADVPDMARILKQDLAMSYRLLRYVNTAGTHRLDRPISTIEQALVLLGRAQLDRWLTLLLLSGSTTGGSALMETSLTRARFLELLGEGRLPEAQSEQLFVLGLFSMLDVALRVPLADAIKPLELPGVMSMALLERKGPYGNYLALAEACERGNMEAVCKHAIAVGLSVSRVNARHLAALEWVAVNSERGAAEETAAQPA